MNIIFLDKQTLGNDADFSEIQTLATTFRSFDQTAHEQIVERASDADIIVTNKASINESILKQLPNLQLICITATGTDNIDLQAANKYGVTVKNVADYSTLSVAQHVITLLLSLTTNLPKYHAWTQKGNWVTHNSFNFLDYPIQELANLTLCLIGYGNIAKQVEKIASALGMNIIIAERATETVTRKNRVPFKEALQLADAISIHCPSTPETANIINQQTIELMKDSAILINTARGAIIDERALASAMKSGKFFGVGLDVLSIEPPKPENPLLSINHPNFIITPHIAWAADQSRQRLITAVANNIKDFIS